MNQQYLINNSTMALTGVVTSNQTTLTLTSAIAAQVAALGLTNGDYVLFSFAPAADESKSEIVKVTGVTGNVATIVRGQEGTTAQAWAANDRFVARYTAGTHLGVISKINQPKLLRKGNIGTRILTGRGGARNNTTRMTERVIYEVQGEPTQVRAIFCNSYAAFPDVNRPNGVISITITTAGSGGTDGTYNLIFSGGGGGSGAAGTFTVAGGVVTTTNITASGSLYASPPTVAFTNAPGLTGVVATAVLTLTLGTTTIGAAGGGMSVRCIPDLQAALNDPTVVPAGVAFGSVSTTVTVAVSGPGRRQYNSTTWQPITPVKRTDGGTGYLVCIDYYVATNTWVGCMGDGLTDDITGWATRTTRQAAVQHFTGNGVLTPSLITAAEKGLKKQAICCGLQYMASDEVRTICVNTDSIGEGRAPGLVGESFIAKVADQAQAQTGIAFEAMNISWSGIASGAFSGFLRDIATGPLNAQVAGGAVPDIVITCVGSPNDYLIDGDGINTTISAARIAANKQGFSDTWRTCRELQIGMIAYNISAVNYSVKRFNTSDSLRIAYNTECATKKGVAVVDVASLTLGGTDGNGQQYLNAADTLDGIHMTASAYDKWAVPITAEVIKFR